MSQLFSGSKRLMELADSIEEIKTTCVNCERKAIINAKFINNQIVYVGSSEPDIGAEEKYKAMCWSCWSI
jgi:thymidine kinase